MTESERERRRRESEEFARSERERKDKLRQASLDAAAAEEAAVERAKERGDRDWEIEMKRALGDWISDIEEDLPKTPTTAEMKKAQEALGEIRRLSRAKKSGKAKRVARKNKKVIHVARKQAKAQKSCAVMALLILSAFGAAGWGIFEAVAAIVA